MTILFQVLNCFIKFLLVSGNETNIESELGEYFSKSQPDSISRACYDCPALLGDSCGLTVFGKNVVKWYHLPDQVPSSGQKELDQLDEIIRAECVAKDFKKAQRKNIFKDDHEL